MLVENTTLIEHRTTLSLLTGLQNYFVLQIHLCNIFQLYESEFYQQKEGVRYSNETPMQSLLWSPIYIHGALRGNFLELNNN